MVRASILVLLLAGGPGCSPKPYITVGTKNFTEQVVLGEVIAQQIERRTGIRVDRKFNLGGTLLAHESLRSGAIDLYPEYTGTALTAILKRPVLSDPKTVLDRVREGYRQWELVWLDPLGFNNTFAMVVRSDDVRERHLETITDAARDARPWRLGVGYEFVQRPDGLDGLVKKYGLRIDGQPVTMDLGLLYPALESRNIDMAAANATDGLLSRPEFKVLTDDRGYFPPYECAVVIRQDALSRFPQIRGTLAELSGRISDSAMRSMNAAVDLDHRPVTDVAREFLAWPAR